MTRLFSCAQPSPPSVMAMGRVQKPDVHWLDKDEGMGGLIPHLPRPGIDNVYSPSTTARRDRITCPLCKRLAKRPKEGKKR